MTLCPLRPHRRRGLAVLAVVSAALATYAAAPATAARAAVRPAAVVAASGKATAASHTRPLASVPVSTNPLATRPLYADPLTWAGAQAAKASTADGRAAARLVAVPQAKWIGPNDQQAWIADYVSRATAARQLPMLVLYAVPGRDCGGYSAGGLSTSAAYVAWVKMVRQAIAVRPTTVIVEPDALASGSCSGRAADTDARIAMIAGAVDVLTADASTAVYLDAGHEWWMTADVAADRLARAHVAKARGFSLNVSNFYTTASEAAFGARVVAGIRARVPSSAPHFVVDTSRNGNGPAPASRLNWCNPSGRLLGQRPAATTDGGALDGVVWVKHPGESDGTCERSVPGSGQWFGSWATDIVSRSLTAGLLG